MRPIIRCRSRAARPRRNLCVKSRLTARGWGKGADCVRGQSSRVSGWGAARESAGVARGDFAAVCQSDRDPWTMPLNGGPPRDGSGGAALDQFSAGRVDDGGTVLRLGENRVVEEVLGRGTRRYVDVDIADPANRGLVAIAHQVFDGMQTIAAGGIAWLQRHIGSDVARNLRLLGAGLTACLPPGYGAVGLWLALRARACGRCWPADLRLVPVRKH